MNDGVKINKRRLKSAVLLIMLALLLASAGGCSKDSQKNGEIDIQELASGMQDLVVIYSPASSMDVSEMMIIKLSDKAQIESVEAAIESRISAQTESFGGYAPEQCALLEDYIVRISDDIVFYAVADNSEELRNAFLDGH